MKKLLLTLGTIATIAIPTLSVIACGDDSKTDTPPKTKEPEKNIDHSEEVKTLLSGIKDKDLIPLETDHFRDQLNSEDFKDTLTKDNVIEKVWGIKKDDARLHGIVVTDISDITADSSNGSLDVNIMAKVDNKEFRTEKSLFGFETDDMRGKRKVLEQLPREIKIPSANNPQINGYKFVDVWYHHFLSNGGYSDNEEIHDERFAKHELIYDFDTFSDTNDMKAGQGYVLWEDVFKKEGKWANENIWTQIRTSTIKRVGDSGLSFDIDVKWDNTWDTINVVASGYDLLDKHEWSDNSWFKTWVNPLA